MCPLTDHSSIYLAVRARFKNLRFRVDYYCRRVCAKFKIQKCTNSYDVQATCNIWKCSNLYGLDSQLHHHQLLFLLLLLLSRSPTLSAPASKHLPWHSAAASFPCVWCPIEVFVGLIMLSVASVIDATSTQVLPVEDSGNFVRTGTVVLPWLLSPDCKNLLGLGQFLCGLTGCCSCLLCDDAVDYWCGWWRSCFMARLSKVRKKKKTNNPALDNNAAVFSWKSWQKKGHLENSHLRWERP